MTIVRFQIGTAFPAGNDVARFVTVVAMMSNDWMRIINELLTLDRDDPESEARRMMLFRQQAALHHEAALRLEDGPKQIPEIATFIASLDSSAKEDYETVVGGRDPRSPHFLGKWYESHRHVTFHYPILHPARAESGNEELKIGLEKAAGLESTITWENDDFSTVRFRFADEVSVQWLPDEESGAIERLRESGLALARYVQRAVEAYLNSLPPGRFTIESD